MPEPLEECPICHWKAFRFRPVDYDGTDIDCGYCGDFSVTGSVLPQLASLSIPDRKKIFQWIYEQQLSGEKPKIDSHVLSTILARPLKSFSEIVNQILLYLDKTTIEFGQFFQISDPKLLHPSGTFDWTSYDRIIRSLPDMNLINFTGDQQQFYLTPDGFEKIEKIKHTDSQGLQGFVAMWFDDQMRSAWDHGFQPAITEAGYLPRRIDLKDHVNKICDEIVLEIRRSKFLVADFTGQRGGVYYEAGFAHGLGIPVIFTCKDDEIKNLHFDIRQYNFINWKDASDLNNRLRARIGAAVGHGPIITKPS